MYVEVVVEALSMYVEVVVEALSINVRRGGGRGSQRL